MDLTVWSGDWGLASIDPNCLAMMTYAKFSGSPVQIKETNSPFWSPTGFLPIFRKSQDDGSQFKITEFSSFVKKLKEFGFSADYNLSAKQASELYGYQRLITDKLAPALWFVFWVDNRNQNEVTRPCFGKRMGVPWSLYYPNKYAKHAMDVSRGHVDGTEDLNVIENAIHKNAEECLTILANRLGTENPFFFGKSPSSLDALLYGFLGPLLKAPLPSSFLQNHLKACPNLVTFVVRISQTYFPQHAINYEKKKLEGDAEKPTKPFEYLRPILSASFGLAAMAGYAYLHINPLLAMVTNQDDVRYSNEEEND